MKLINKCIRFNELCKNANPLVLVAFLIVPGLSQLIDKLIRHSYEDVNESIDTVDNALKDYLDSWNSSLSQTVALSPADKQLADLEISENLKKLDQYNNFFDSFQSSIDNTKSAINLIISSNPKQQDYIKKLENYNKCAIELQSNLSTMNVIVDKLKTSSDHFADIPAGWVGVNLFIRTNTQHLQQAMLDLQNELVAFAAKVNYGVKNKESWFEEEKVTPKNKGEEISSSPSETDLESDLDTI